MPGFKHPAISDILAVEILVPESIGTAIAMKLGESWDSQGGSFPMLGADVKINSSFSPQDSAEPHPWFAVWVKGRVEQSVANHLQSRGYDPFVPTFVERRHWSDRVRKAEQPLFPGYLFCRIDPGDRLPILTAPGVIQILGAGKTLLPVPEAEIQAIQAIVRSDLPKRPWPYLEVGQRVRIGSGPLRGVEGILTENRGDHRLVVSVELLRRAVAVELDPRATSLLSLGSSPKYSPALC